MHGRRYSILYSAASLVMLPAIGCATGIVIPGSAKVVDSGAGRLHYIAEDNGKIYLLDSTAKKAVFGAHLNRDDKLTVDTDLDLIDVAGKPTDHKPPLSSDHVYRLYFDRDG